MRSLKKQMKTILYSVFIFVNENSYRNRIFEFLE